MKTDVRPMTTRLKDLLWVLLIAGLVAGIGRFVHGLGAATNMHDLLPWGIWKVFNMVAGAALATSGFVVAALITIFQIERYRPVARFSILVGFLGYGSSLVALLFDIGLPHRAWHPFVMWNPHSFLFEVFWCVSIYWAVTAFELLPVITERLPFPRLTHFIHEIILPVVILGITLSTMHHSSLGSLFMASPTRLHPLWYSLWIPPAFFISAMGAGLAVIVLLLIVFSYLYRLNTDMKLLSGLYKGSAGLLFGYLVVKAADYTMNDKWHFVFGEGITWESRLFWVEISLQAILPLVVFIIPSFRKSVVGLVMGTSSALAGLVLHRINTGIVGYFRSAESIYLPNFSEVLLSAGLIAGAALLFFMLVERFYIFEEPPAGQDMQSTVAKRWSFSEVREVFAGRRLIKVIVTAVMVIPAVMFLLRDQATGLFRPQAQPITAPVISEEALREGLKLDANMNGNFVEFSHAHHQEAFAETDGLEKEQTCRKCHHLSLPGDNNTVCRACHNDMLLEQTIFNVEKHRHRFKSESEWKAVVSMAASDRVQIQDACLACHRDNMPGLKTTANEKGFHRWVGPPSLHRWVGPSSKSTDRWVGPSSKSVFRSFRSNFRAVLGLKVPFLKPKSHL